MSKQKDIVVYGSGGMGREVAWLLSHYEARGEYNMLGFIEDDPARTGQLINGKQVVSLDGLMELGRDCLVTVAIGDPAVRAKLVDRCRARDLRFATLLHHDVQKSAFVSIGEGTVICAGTILTVNIDIGRQVQINTACTIAHDVRIGDFATLAPGVRISGHVHIGKSAYIGTGASVINGSTDEPLIIAPGTVVGAGACLTRSTEPDSLYVGVPAVRKR